MGIVEKGHVMQPRVKALRGGLRENGSDHNRGTLKLPG